MKVSDIVAVEVALSLTDGHEKEDNAQLVHKMRTSDSSLRTA